VASDLVRQAADRSHSVASWLDGRDPGSLLDEVKTFARRRPGTFLLLAAGAGVLAGRLGRSLQAGAPASTGASTPSVQQPGYPAAYPTTGPGVTGQGVTDPGVAAGVGAPFYDEPAVGHPGLAEPTYGEPAYGEPGAAQPAYGEPAFGEPGAAQPAYGEPAFGEPAYGEPGAAQPPYGEPAFGEPTFDDPARRPSTDPDAEGEGRHL
jgi:hypothetical protein